MKQEKTIAARKAQRDLTEQSLSRERFVISQYLSRLQLPPRFMGVDEEAVWRAMEKLCRLYEDALTVERSKREQAEYRLEALRKREEPSDA